MPMTRSIATLICVAMLAFAGCSAPEYGGSGTVTIDGNIVALPCARAWASGHVMGRPLVYVVLSEKPLDGATWWELGLRSGKRGVTLVLQPTPSSDAMPVADSVDYIFQSDYQAELHAHGDLPPWSGKFVGVDGITSKALTVDDYTDKSGHVRGELAWSGNVELHGLDDKANRTLTTVTAWTAKFDLLAEPMGERPRS